tara:strand:- start:3400 stop:3753 length:354 start_codon:yes stop_codon:yes gene_type:complete
MKLYPECFDIKERREKHSASKEFGMSNDGYLLPCCWADGESWKRPENGHGHKCDYVHALHDEELKIENNESIEEILLSDQWINFYQALERGYKEDISYAPKLCQYYCGKKNATKSTT